MKKLIVVLSILISGIANGQWLTNYYLEPGSSANEVVLNTSFYYFHGAGFIESSYTVTDNVIDFSICYILSATASPTYDDQEHIINLPNTHPNYIVNVNLHLWDQNLNSCDYGMVADGGPINFDTPYNPSDLVQVPDDNFEGLLEEMNLGDEMINNLVFKHRIENISRLTIDQSLLSFLGLNPIEDLTGIEYLLGLEYFRFEDSLIQEFDATNNTSLEELRLSDNLFLTSIDLSFCTNLNYLEIGINQLSALDVSNNSNLSYLGFRGIDITEIDLSQNVNLSYLSMYETGITTLDLSQNISLNNLRVSRTAITSLDLFANQSIELLRLNETEINSLSLNHPFLKEIELDENLLTNLDLSLCPALEVFGALDEDGFVDLDFSQNPLLHTLLLSAEVLVSLDLRNGNNNNMNSLFILDSNQSLYCISVDDENLAPYPGWTVIGPAIYSNDCALGFSDSEVNLIEIYPNPVNSVLNIQSQETINSYQLYDISGKLVFSSEENIDQIDFSNYSSGLYFLKINTEKGAVFQKIVKE